MKKLIFGLLILFSCAAHGQLLMTKNATISFHSHTFLENVDAVNKNVMAVIDAGKKKYSIQPTYEAV